MDNIAEIHSRAFKVGISGLSLAATPTNVFSITGAFGTAVLIHKISITGTAATASQLIPVSLIKQSTPDTGGTFTLPSIVPMNSRQVIPPAAIVKAYTANPTVGTVVGTVESEYIPFTLSTAVGNTPTILDFDGFPVYLNNEYEQFVVNLAGVALANATKIAVNIVWSEI